MINKDLISEWFEVPSIVWLFLSTYWIYFNIGPISDTIGAFITIEDLYVFLFHKYLSVGPSVSLQAPVMHAFFFRRN